MGGLHELLESRPVDAGRRPWSQGEHSPAVSRERKR